MAWTSLRNRLAGLPLVLAGPILRRTESTSLTVWVALKQSRTVTLELYSAAGTLLFSAAPQPTVAVGDNLHIAALTAQLPTTQLLAPGQNYTYDLLFNDGKRLAGAGVLSPAGGAVAVSYAPFTRPSFALPPADLGALRVFHGSCRKPHGESLDAMAGLDAIVRKDIAVPNKRPHQLFLTGDQIYADDVADALLFMLRDAADTLLGWSETLPDVTDAAGLLPGARAALSLKAGFTAGIDDEDAAKSHLLALGEYCAMYLFAWSDVLWPAELPAFAEVFAGQPGRRKTKQFAQELGRLRDFQRELGSARRALANIPTYMIFDDHEITDDWFINMDWCRKVIKSPLGRRAVQNGLAAFALFQGWGNTPSQFALSASGGKLLQAAAQLNTARGSDEAARQQIAYAVGLPHSNAEADVFVADLEAKQFLSHVGQRPWHQAIRWHYHIAWPQHEVVALDSRTWRAFPGGGKEFAALLSNEAFQEQILNLPATQAEVTLVVSPAPVVGVPFVEWFQKHPHFDLNPFKLFKDQRLERDSESWGLRRYAFERLFARLARRGPERRFVLLCGDVHYGYSTRLQYWAKRPFETDQDANARAIFAQLTASSFKNQKTAFLAGTTRLHRSGYNPIELFDSLPETREVFGWTNPQAEPKQIGKLQLLLIPYAWFTDSGNPALTYANDLLATGKELTAAPDWRYRIDYLLAEHEIDDEFQPVAPSPPPADRTQALKEYLLAAKNYDDYAERWGHGKEIVGLNNIGEVTFQWGAAKAVVHQVWWRLEKESGPLDLFPLTRYVVSLNFDDPKYPMPPLD
jgi:hypothetical protein